METHKIKLSTKVIIVARLVWFTLARCRFEAWCCKMALIASKN